MTHSVAAVVVDYHAEQDLLDCVDSLMADGVTNVVVVDNSTTGASAAVLGDRSVRLVDTAMNLGYGRGMNRGVAFAGSPEFLVISNPDIVVHRGAVAALISHLVEHPRVGIVGPTIVDPSGATYPSLRIFPNIVLAGLHAVLAPLWPNNPATKRYRSPGRDGHVDWVSGAFFVVRSEAFQQVGGFDERYFMFAEDMDLCWQLVRAGWQVDVVADAVVTHTEGVSRARAPRAMVRAHHQSALRFEARTARGPRRLLLPLAAVLLGARYVVMSALAPRRR